jgi:hypothetical protein
VQSVGRLERANKAEVDVVGSEAFEKSSPLAEKDWDELDFEHVQDPCPQAFLRGVCTMQHDVAIPGSRFGLLDARFDAVGDETHITRVSTTGCSTCRDEDRHAIVMIAAPVVDEVSGSSTGEHGTGGQHLVEHCLTRLIAGPVATGFFSAVAQPFVQPVALCADLVSAGPAMYPSRDIDMYSTSRGLFVLMHIKDLSGFAK